MDPPIVALDTSVLKHAVDRHIVGEQVAKRINWGGQTVDATVTRWRERYPAERVSRAFRRHIKVLPFIAHLARRGRLDLRCHHEVVWEFFGLPRTTDSRGRFYGAPLGRLSDPIRYTRMIAGGTEDPKTLFVTFLEGLEHPRFLAIQKMTGARQGSRILPNQLVDAFHIWAADTAGVDFFLTTDIKLIRLVTARSAGDLKVRIAAPTQLLAEPVIRTRTRASDRVTYWWHRIRRRNRGPSGHPLESLLEFSRRRDDADNFG